MTHKTKELKINKLLNAISVSIGSRVLKFFPFPLETRIKLINNTQFKGIYK
jgi:hypothetical protein